LESFKRIEVRLPADHSLFSLPPKLRGQKARELIKTGEEITRLAQVTQTSIMQIEETICTKFARLEQIIQNINQKLDHVMLLPAKTSTTTTSKEDRPDDKSTGFDHDSFLKSFE